jgi:hypothetical protein
MGKSLTFDSDILALIFNATAIANIADNAASSPLTNLYVSLHTADPGTGGSQTTNEISYTGYARVAVARTSGGWMVGSGTVSPAANVTFGLMTGGTGGTVSYWAVGTLSSGTGKVLYSGAVSPTMGVSNGSTPVLSSTSTITES